MLARATLPFALALLSSPVRAEPRWRLDLSARAIGSVELDDRAMQTRDGLVPALGVRVERQLGGFAVGGALTAGLPAYAGTAEAALAIDHERVLARPTCELVTTGPDDLGSEHCRGARWSLVLGLDAGVALYYFDAPPETDASSDALIYWGPLARARVQLHALDLLPTSRAVGVVVGASAAFASAHYTSTASGTGVRVEPELEVGLTMRL